MNNVEQMHKYIQNVAKKAVGPAAEQTVLSGVIKQCCAGVYKIQLTTGNESSLIDATALYQKDNFKENDVVFLLKATTTSGENTTDNFFIFGLVDTVKREFEVASASERFIAAISTGTNIPKSDNITKNGANLIQSLLESNIDTKLLILQNITLHGYIKLSANFTFNRNDRDKDIGLKDYGLQISVSYKNSSNVDNFKLNTQWFTGQAYNLNNSTQHRFIQLDINKKDFVKDISITAFNEFDYSTFNVSNVVLESGNVQEALDKMSLKIVNNNEDGRDFVYGEPEQEKNTIELLAEGYYESQLLSANLLKYFWFVKDESITEDSKMIPNTPGYNPLLGPGWRSLTTFRYGQVINKKENGAQELVDDESIRIWDAGKNTFTFDFSTLTKYENIIKCVATYNSAAIESTELKLYNFNHEEVDASLSTDTVNLIIISANDEIELKCDVINKNITQNIEFIYKWYVDNKIIDEYSESTLKVTSSFPEGFKTGKKKFKCEVYVQKDQDNILVAETNSIEIESLVQEFENSELEEIIDSKIWISVENNEKFIKENIDENTFAYLDWKSQKGIEPIVGEPSNDDLYSALKDGEYFIYHSTQSRVQNKLKVLKQIKDWTKPVVARVISKNDTTIIDIYDEGAIEELNTFNSLTNNGTADGIYFDDSGEEKQLYINATYINTGAFTVQDKDSNDVIFQAGWEQDENGDPVVSIAGFEVTKDSISSEDVILSKEKLQVGSEVAGLTVAKINNGEKDEWQATFTGHIIAESLELRGGSGELEEIIQDVVNATTKVEETQIFYAKSKINILNYNEAKDNVFIDAENNTADWYVKNEFFTTKNNDNQWPISKEEINEYPFVFRKEIDIYGQDADGAQRTGNPRFYVEKGEDVAEISAEILYGEDFEGFASPIGRWCKIFNKTFIDGGSLITGSIKADELSSISANLGTITTGIITGGDYKKIIQKWS